MGRFETTKATINANIKQNGKQAITGSILNSVMTEMVDATDAELAELHSESKNVESLVGQNSIDVVYTEKDFAGVYWDGTSVKEKAPTVDSFIVMLPVGATLISYKALAGTMANTVAFNSYPQIGTTDKIDFYPYDGYTNTTDKVIFLLFSFYTATSPEFQVKMTSGGLLGNIYNAKLGNIIRNISIEELGTSALDGIKVTIPKGIIIAFPNKKTTQPSQDITLSANNAYVYYLLVKENGEFYITYRLHWVMGDAGALIAVISPKTPYPVQGIESYKYNGTNYGLVDVDSIPKISEEIAKQSEEIAKQSEEIANLKNVNIDTYAVNALQGLSYNHNKITPDNVKNAIKKIWFSCQSEGNIEKVLANLNEVYLARITNKPGAYSPYVGMSTKEDSDDQVFNWYLTNQTEARSGIETIQLTIQSSVATQFGITSGYYPKINIEIDWDIFGQNVEEKLTIGIKIDLTKIWRFEREDVTINESAKGFVANSLIGKTIVCFGDSITEMVDITNSLHYTDYIAMLSGANVINCGIGGSQLRQRMNTSLTPAHNSQAYAALDIVNMVEAACEQDFTLQLKANQYIIDSGTNDDNSTPINNLINVDWSKVDAVTFFAGTNDWYTANSLGQTGSNERDKTLGAINEIIRMLLSTYPHVKIFFFTPIVRWLDYSETDGKGTDENWSDNYVVEGNGTLKEESEKIANEVKANHIPVCDMYNTLGWNKYNCVNYFHGTDGTHPRKVAGVMMLAKKILSFIMSNNTL